MMRDDFQVPNVGQAPDAYDASFFSRMARNIELTFQQIRSLGRASVTTAVFYAVTVDALPTDAQPGSVTYAKNGRKVGEGPGAGTGVLVFYDGTAWRACDTSQTVSA